MFNIKKVWHTFTMYVRYYRHSSYNGMYWDHRVLRREYTSYAGSETQYEIHEVYYDKNDKPTMCTENAIAATGETLEEVQQALMQMIAAAQKPILNWEDFGRC